MRIPFMAGQIPAKKTRVSDGAWIAWWPKGEPEPPVYRHWVEDEDEMWGPPTRTICDLRMGDNGALYIGTASEPVTLFMCPECVVAKAAVAKS